MFFEHADICSGPRTPFGSRSISAYCSSHHLKMLLIVSTQKVLRVGPCARSVPPYYPTRISFAKTIYRSIYCHVKLNRIGTIDVAKTAKQSLIVTVSKDRNINNVARDSIARLRKVRGWLTCHLITKLIPGHQTLRFCGDPSRHSSWLASATTHAVSGGRVSHS